MSKKAQPAPKSSARSAWIPLLALELLMAVFQVGDLPVPGPGKAITLMHLPVILAGVLSGPLPAGLIGLVFGVSTWMHFPPNDWIVHVVPRVLMGFAAGLTFDSARSRVDTASSISAGAFFAAVVGSLTNTLGVTILAAAEGYNLPEELLQVIVFHGVPECVAAVLVVVPFAISVYHQGARKRLG